MYMHIHQRFPKLKNLVDILENIAFTVRLHIHKKILYMYRIFSNTTTDPILTEEISILGIFRTFTNAVTDDLYQKITRSLKL